MLQSFRRAAVRCREASSERRHLGQIASSRPATYHSTAAAQSGQPGDSRREPPEPAVAAMQLTTNGISTSNEDQLHLAADRHRRVGSRRRGRSQHCGRGRFFSKAQIVGLDPDDKSFVNEKRISHLSGQPSRRRSVAQHRPETSSSEDHHRQRQPSPGGHQGHLCDLVPTLGGWRLLRDRGHQDLLLAGPRGELRRHVPGYHHEHDQRSS